MAEAGEATTIEGAKVACLNAGTRLLSALAELVVEGVTSMKEMNRKDKEYADEVAGGRGSKKVKG